MNKYAVIDGGMVTNLIVWDGKNELPTEIGEPVLATENVSIGWLYDGNEFSSPPEPDKSQDEISSLNIANAQNEYEKSTAKINSLNEIIQDSDFVDMSEDIVKSSLAEWISYRKELRSYLKSNGLSNLPGAPEDFE